MGEAEVMLAVIGVFGAIFTALFKLLTDNTAAIKGMTDASNKVAAATMKGNEEAKKRNGHLGEQNVQITELIMGQNKDLGAIRVSNENNAKVNLKALKLAEKNALILKKNTEITAKATQEVARMLKNTDGTQLVENQTVQHQTIKNKG